MLKRIVPVALVVMSIFFGLTGFDRTRTRSFHTYQCTWYVAIRRPDVWYWLPETGADAANWANIATRMGVPVSRAADPGFSILSVKRGDILVLTDGYDGADPVLGHVAFVESVDYQKSEIHISEYFNKVYAERDLSVLPVKYMSFVHMPPFWLPTHERHSE